MRIENHGLVVGLIECLVAVLLWSRLYLYFEANILWKSLNVI